MNPPRICPRCGFASAEDWTGEVCPACAMEHGLLGNLADPRATSTLGTGLAMNERPFGDYQLLEEIASGGMGVVYRALQVRLNRIVALKMIRPGHLARAEERARFRAEAEAAARLQHPNIVAIYEVSEQEGHPFYTMEFIEGRSLAHRMGGDPLRPEQAARYVQVIAGAMFYAHQRGVLHRDLKPSNVVLDASDTPHVTDFGLAKVLANDSDLTQPGTVMGSPSYMPPEQAQGRVDAMDARSDGYALGAILYELLTGRPPFRSSTVVETLRLVVEQEPVPPRALNPGLPRDLETICLKCLSKAPGARYQNAQELADELGRFLQHQPIRARPPGPAGRLRRWCRRQPALAAAAGISFCLLAALALVSTLAAFRLHRTGEQTRLAQLEAEEALRVSQFERARAERWSAVAGRKARALAAIAAAARAKPSRALQDEAVATLGLTDLGPPVWEWSNTNELRGNFMGFDSTLERCAIARETGAITIVRTADHQVLQQLSAPADRPDGVQFSPDGRYLCVAYGRYELVAWDLKSGTPVVRFGRRSNGTHPAFDAASRHLFLIATGSQIVAFELGGGDHAQADENPEPVLEGPAQWIATGRRSDELAVGVGDEVQLWNLTEHRIVRSFQLSSPAVCIAWHPDDRRIALGLVTGEFVLWDRLSDRRITTVGHSGSLDRIGFDPTGELLWSSGGDGVTRFWNAADGISVFESAEGQAVAFDRAGRRLAYLLPDNSLGIWPVVRSETLRGFALPILESEITSLSLSSNGHWLAAGTGSGWCLVDMGQRQPASAVSLGQPTRVALHPDGQSVAGVTRDEVIRWPLQWQTNAGIGGVSARVGAGETLFSARGRELQRISFSARGDLLGVVGHHTNALLRWLQPSSIVPFSVGVAQSFLSLSPEGSRLAAADYFGRGVTLWDTSNGRLLRDLLPRDRAQVRFSADGRTLATLTRECTLWDTASWQPRRHLPVPRGIGSQGSLAFSGDNRLLVMIEGYRFVRLIDPATGDDLATLTPPSRLNLSAVAVSADGSTVVAATHQRTIYCWDLRALHRALAPLGLDWRQ